jgi:diaminohydroxyphosphoribosylaminopyrimidine deaminase/5-amino-6-(5-phosphoribosylamino)uracil reductase
MDRALALAESGWPGVFPNPMVGAVILDGEGGVIGEARHECCGAPHAEIMAMEGARKGLEGATLVVTLEPCAHQGRTPPCVDRIVSSGIRRVVAAMTDPDPRVSGRGFEYLRNRGIEVVTGVREREALDLNRVWIHCLKTRRSFLHLKMAVSLDGRAAASDGSSRWITGPESRKRVREMREKCHAVMVGSGTVLLDNPSLVHDGPGPRPVRIVVSGSPLPGELNVYSDGGRTITAVPRGADWIPRGEFLVFDDLGDLLAGTLSLGLGLVLCEGGPRLATALVNEALVDRISVFTAPKLLGGGGVPVFHDLWITGVGSALSVEDVVSERLGGDTLVEGRLVYRSD